MKVELLAPGGSFDSVIAAYNAGADAVYVGGEMFGARAGADNLTTEQLIEVLNYAHIHNKKLYLTINTLLKDSEIENRLYDFIAPLYENGLDAVIVQDMGVLEFVRFNFPKLHIHASTQMTIFGKETVEVLKEMGVSRIVTPRELSLCEIKDIHENSDIEIESFVHGALCYCYSGQCFLSSYIGGRSGNRGRCAQPCRMEYDVIYNEQVINSGNNKYVLSPKDICTLKILPQIIEAGVYSLKIEGRMKKLEYIAGVTSVYRKYIDLYLTNPDNYKIEQKDMDTLYDLFNRNGFNESYYRQHNGKNMISLKKPEFRKENRELNQFLKNTFSGKKLKKEIDVEIVCRKDNPFEITTSIDDNRITVKGETPETAVNKPIDKESIEKQMRKTGNTDFSIRNITITLDDNLFLPIGTINELRRRFLDELEKAALKKYRRTLKNANEKDCLNAKDSLEETKNNSEEIKDNSEETKDSFCINADVWNYEQFQAVSQFDFVKRIYLECSGMTKEQLLKAIQKGKSLGKQIYMAMPYVFRKKDKEYFDKNYLEYVKYTDGALIRSPEQFYHLKNLKVVNNYIFDYNVYTENQQAKLFYSNKGKYQTTVPLELNYRELIKRGCRGDEMIVYGYMPAMLSAGCCLKTCGMCNAKNAVYDVKDRLGNYFKTRCVCEYCYNIMYNCKPLSLLKFSREIKELNPDSVRLTFVLESQDETKNILKRAEQAFVKETVVREDDKSTRGHFKRGVL